MAQNMALNFKFQLSSIDLHLAQGLVSLHISDKKLFLC